MHEKVVVSICVVIYCITMISAGPRLHYDFARSDMGYSRPPYVRCISTAECDKSECCAINQGRFAIPTCRPRQELGDQCRPDNVPYSVNLTYPDDVTVFLKDVHLIMCPCQNLLTCSSNGECIDPTDESGFNYVNDSRE